MGQAGILSLGPGKLRFRGLVGTGGIGHGTFFLLEGNQTLGREESRGGRFLDRRDYCKLHIISHYLKRLLGDRAEVYPVGAVGDDEAGGRLRAEMGTAGLDLRFVATVHGAPTLYSFCFLYPDGTGGNLTTVDGASGHVDAAAVRQAEPVAASLGRSGIALAAPEVPWEAREEMLALGSRYGLFRVASFARAEMQEARARGLLARLDLLAVNLEEALAAAGLESGRAHGASFQSKASLAARAVEALSRKWPRLEVSVTAGPDGSWVWDGERLSHWPAVSVRVAGTAGSGDAYLAGLLAALAAGLQLSEAQQLATIVAGASVTSVHTIHPQLSRDLLRATCAAAGEVSPKVRDVLGT